jgi:hypothetical protein
VPLKSKSQLAKFGAMARTGEISKETFKKWRDETPNIKNLPQRVKSKKKK